MTVSEAIDMVLNMAKAEYDNSNDLSPRKLKRMQEAITTFESWVDEVRALNRKWNES